MPDLLPKGKKPIQRVNPKISLFYAIPKMGKTELLTKLDDCLILATEDGVEMYEANYLRITSVAGGTTYYEKGHELEGQIKTTSLNNFFEMMNAEAKRQMDAKEPLKFPYTYIGLDTIDELETMAEVSATAKFFATPIGRGVKDKNPNMKSVIELPNGGGYYHLRNELIELIEKLAKYTKYLILISHVRDKVLDKGGISVEFRDISLTGKLGQIIAAKCDIIGYLYRETGKPGVQVSFETMENTTMGARFPRLAGKRMPFDWNVIFLPEDVKEVSGTKEQAVTQ